MRFSYLIYTFLIFSVLPLPSFSAEKVHLIVFHAGSLTVPFKAAKRKFERLHPEIDVRLEPSGSVQAIRKVTDLKKNCDVVASADYSLIPNLMFPKFSDHVYAFARNELVLCYTDRSKYSEAIKRNNWYEILKKSGVKWGFSNPNLDPCGYRTLMALGLADFYYKRPVFENLLSSSNISLTKKRNGILITVLNSLRTNPHIFIRPKAVALLGLLENGTIDYAFEYKSVALQHRLKFVELPPEINLSSIKLKDLYSKVSVRLANGKLIKGKPIVYGITTVLGAPHPKEANLWENFIISREGAEILRRNYQEPICPPILIQANKR
ncbi:MAG: tungstate ABC transporter substrate-binding protein WtpA [Thermovibrio sp.]|nr:MAG: tungstate ABC transporter substrate-binding protein WtpA [Thermovibrio sp.]